MTVKYETFIGAGGHLCTRFYPEPEKDAPMYDSICTDCMNFHANGEYPASDESFARIKAVETSWIVQEYTGENVTTCRSCGYFGPDNFWDAIRSEDIS